MIQQHLFLTAPENERFPHPHAAWNLTQQIPTFLLQDVYFRKYCSIFLCPCEQKVNITFPKKGRCWHCIRPFAFLTDICLCTLGFDLLYHLLLLFGSFLLARAITSLTNLSLVMEWWLQCSRAHPSWPKEMEISGSNQMRQRLQISKLKFIALQASF